MPTPPTITYPNKVVGGPGNIAYSSWAKLRGVISDYSYSDLTIDGDHSLTYRKGFKTTQGNGLIRTEWAWSGYTTIPSFQTWDYNLTDSKLNFGSRYYGSSSGTICNDDRAQLVGQSVSLTIYPAGVATPYTLTIATSAFDSPPKHQEFTASSTIDPVINSIGLLTAF